MKQKINFFFNFWFSLFLIGFDFFSVFLIFPDFFFFFADEKDHLCNFCCCYNLVWPSLRRHHHHHFFYDVSSHKLESCKTKRHPHKKLQLLQVIWNHEMLLELLGNNLKLQVKSHYISCGEPDFQIEFKIRIFRHEINFFDDFLETRKVCFLSQFCISFDNLTPIFLIKHSSCNFQGEK